MDWINALWKPGRENLECKKVLIAGCGTGAEAFRMQRRQPGAQIVAVDFTPRSIAIARRLQRRAPETRAIRFRVADLAKPGLSELVGRDFDFVSCHGVLSYIPTPEAALRNLARCLKPDGGLYLGVNGSGHASVGLRRVLPAFGFEMDVMKDDDRHLREVLGLCDAMLERAAIERVAKYKAGLLASDVFGPLISNLSLDRWVRIARRAGLHFRGSYQAWRATRAAVASDSGRLLMPRSRAQVCELADRLWPRAFHRTLFTREPEANPPWEKPEALLSWRPTLTSLYRGRLPTRSHSWRKQRTFTLKSPATNTRLDWRLPEWALEILRLSDGQRTLGSILAALPIGVPWRLLQRQLYVLHQLLVLTLVPAPGR
jgi:SAM-dependent methyltransferase